MKTGDHITFNLDTWQGDQHKVIEVKAEVLRISKDPLNKHEPKCSVKYKNEEYGIPFSEVKRVYDMNIKTTSTPFKELNPGDKIYVPRIQNSESKMPEINTVRYLDHPAKQVVIEESGGVCLVGDRFDVVISQNIKKQAGIQTSLFDI